MVAEQVIHFDSHSHSHSDVVVRMHGPAPCLLQLVLDVLDLAAAFDDAVNCVEDFVLRVAGGEAGCGDGEEACAEGDYPADKWLGGVYEGGKVRGHTDLSYGILSHRRRVHDSAVHFASRS